VSVFDHITKNRRSKMACMYTRVPPHIHNTFNQAQSEYRQSLTFHVRCYAVTATKLMHQLQICPIVHNWRAPPTIPPNLHPGTQTSVTTIHFASAMPHTNCNNTCYYKYTLLLYLPEHWYLHWYLHCLCTIQENSSIFSIIPMC